MTDIIIGYWHFHKFEDLDYEHNQVFEYSVELRNNIINDVLNSGYNVMLYQNDTSLIIWIDKHRFKQR